MTQNSPSSEQQLAGNSPASRDIAFHMHPYTNPAMLGDAGPHIMAQGNGVFVVDDAGNQFPTPWVLSTINIDPSHA